MNTGAIARSILILWVIGTLVSAQQAGAESVFARPCAEAVEKLTLRPLDLTSAAPSAAGALSMNYLSVGDDTTETFDVQVEEDKGPGMVKQLVVFGIITAVVAYSVIVLMSDDSESDETTKPGKEIPTFARVGVQFTR
ncbi:MAG: hypothetical protein PHD74_09325 [Candidatus Krumholzibacteria bacterium]|nr:hypothetical protein [Candidatus Krumholzibacteria bacterium]